MTPLEWPLWWRGDRRLALEHRDLEAVVAQRELARRREADDPGADHGDVAFAGGWSASRHACETSRVVACP